MDKSILVQKQARDNSQDLQNEYLDLRNWEADMKRKEKELESLKDDQVCSSYFSVVDHIIAISIDSLE